MTIWTHSQNINKQIWMDFTIHGFYRLNLLKESVRYIQVVLIVV